MRIKVQFSQSRTRLPVKLRTDTGMRYLDVEFSDFQQVTIEHKPAPYTGTYEITPAVESQTLPTAQKLMTQDMQIKAIPYFETSNDFDGETVYIGSEVEIYGD